MLTYDLSEMREKKRDVLGMWHLKLRIYAVTGYFRIGASVKLGLLVPQCWFPSILCITQLEVEG